jgi:hypothetical protein
MDKPFTVNPSNEQNGPRHEIQLSSYRERNTRYRT